MEKEKIKNWANRAREIFFPDAYTCEVCGKEVFDGRSFCPDCARRLPYNDNTICTKCGRAIRESYPVCVECKADMPLYTAARSAFRYEGDVVNLIKKFKTGARYLARPFAKYMAQTVNAFYGSADFMVSVPMTKKEFKRRGYNQSDLLAKALSPLSGIPYRAELLQKTRGTAVQKFLNRKARAQNLIGSFHVRERKMCEGKTVLLVDDVLTTGATASAVARALFSAHAARVLIVTVASVPFREE